MQFRCDVDTSASIFGADSRQTSFIHPYQNEQNCEGGAVITAPFCVGKPVDITMEDQTRAQTTKDGPGNHWKTTRENPEATSSASGLGMPLNQENENKDVAACRSCVELLREAVLNHHRGPQSKPYQLLQSLLLQGEPAARWQNATPAPLVVQLTPDGLQVQIPAEDPMVPKRRWSRLPQERDHTPITTSKPVDGPVLATNLEASKASEGGPHSSTDPSGSASPSSAAAATTTTASAAVGFAAATLQRLATSARSASVPSPSTPPSQSQQQQQRQQLEWLQLSCRRCSETGPEGGARAFVMGPQPLSVVVCHNRLQHPPPPPPLPPQQEPSRSHLALSSSSLSSSGSARDRHQQQQLQQQRLAEMDEILTHELTHVFDVRRLHLDLRDCENLAYSEVRAARAAECAPHYQQDTPSTSASSSPWYYAPAASLSARAQRSCVRHKAVTATHNLFPQHAAACLSRVFDAAWADRRPWTDINGSSTTAPQSSSPPSAGAAPSAPSLSSVLPNTSSSR